MSAGLQPWRARTVLGVLALTFAVLGGRALYLQGMNHDFLQQRGEARYARTIELTATRGMITDRHGEPLAISTPVESVWASPTDFAATGAQLRDLARVIDADAPELAHRLADAKGDFVYLKRQLPPEQAAKAVALNIPGVFLQREYRRYYPAGEVTSHLIGFTNVDDRGQEALELAFEDSLAGKAGSRRVIKDRLGRIVEDVESIRTPRRLL